MLVGIQEKFTWKWFPVHTFSITYSLVIRAVGGIVFTHGVQMGGRPGGRAAGNSLSGLYLRNRKV